MYQVPRKTAARVIKGNAVTRRHTTVSLDHLLGNTRRTFSTLWTKGYSAIRRVLCWQTTKNHFCSKHICGIPERSSMISLCHYLSGGNTRARLGSALCRKRWLPTKRPSFSKRLRRGKAITPASFILCIVFDDGLRMFRQPSIEHWISNFTY